ncbi:MAG: hypothetical protein QOJ01_1743, partial [Solirubrobacterales bacterium]|nr:hypothetical protein [Solirubrobacterales bacterium]
MRVRLVCCLAVIGFVATLTPGLAGASGERILINSKRSGSWQIYRVDGDGTGLTRLTQGNDDALLESVAPDASRLIFYRGFHDYPNLTHYSMGLSGQDVTPFTTSPSATNVIYSPSGGGVAFSGRDNELYKADSDGANPQPLTQPCNPYPYVPCNEFKRHAGRFSPNGRYLSMGFETEFGSGFRILGVPAGTQVAAREGKIADCYASFLDGFSADSRSILDSTLCGFGATRVYLDRLDGSASRTLTPENRSGGVAEFLANGRILLEERRLNENGRPVGRSEDFVVRADGSHRHRIRPRRLGRRGIYPYEDVSPSGALVLHTHYQLRPQGTTKSTT